jgi:deoxyribose-phosphate aldolase
MANPPNVTPNRLVAEAPGGIEVAFALRVRGTSLPLFFSASPARSNSGMGLVLTYDAIAKRIDHSLLGPTLTETELIDGCQLAARYGVASVCIKPFAVPLAARILKGSGVEVGTTVGFPHGGNATSVKVYEAQQAISDGATELDMVINIGHALEGKWADVAADIAAVTRACHEKNAILKVIFENCYLDDAQKIKLCQICGEVGADYVKTSTGYGTGGATFDDLKLMRRASPSQVKLKAAGGVRDLETAIAVAEIGCDRIGASKTAEILDELRRRLA